jgi:hypothetical protein
LTRPGHATREFIDGKRVRHFKPLSLVIVLATLYGLLYHYFIHDLFDVKHITTEENVASASVNVFQWITDHFAYVSLFVIVNATIASYLVFKKQGYNVAEHLVLNTFLYGVNTGDYPNNITHTLCLQKCRTCKMVSTCHIDHELCVDVLVLRSVFQQNAKD